MSRPLSGLSLSPCVHRCESGVWHHARRPREYPAILLPCQVLEREAHRPQEQGEGGREEGTEGESGKGFFYTI